MSENGTKRIGYKLKRCQHFLRLRMDARLGSEGLSMAQYAALSLIQVSPRITNAEIARRAFVTPQSMHRIVTELEREGLVESTNDAHNKRVILRSLTQRGEELASRGHRVSAEVDEEMLRGLDTQEASQFEELLERVAENLRRSAPAADGT